MLRYDYGIESNLTQREKRTLENTQIHTNKPYEYTVIGHSNRNSYELEMRGKA